LPPRSHVKPAGRPLPPVPASVRGVVAARRAAVHGQPHCRLGGGPLIRFLALNPRSSEFCQSLDEGRTIGVVKLSPHILSRLLRRPSDFLGCCCCHSVASCVLGSRIFRATALLLMSFALLSRSVLFRRFISSNSALVLSSSCAARPQSRATSCSGNRE
jgi:hypothetical protein